VTGAILSLALGVPLCAQSESEIRQETNRQNQRISDLRSEVAALEERVRSLEELILRLQESIEALRAAPDASSAADPEVEEARAEDPGSVDDAAPPTKRPSDVFGSPRSILEALRWDFRSDLTKDPSFALGVNANSERARNEAASILSSWIIQMNRKYQQQVTWPVLISRTDEATPDLFRIQPLTSDGEPVGVPFMTTVSRPVARRVENWLDKPDLDSFLMKGTFLPGLSAIDSAREVGKVEDDPEMPSQETSPTYTEVSPYVRFEYSVRISTILPVFKTEDGAENAAEAPAGSSSEPGSGSTD